MERTGEFPNFQDERDKSDAVPVLTRAIEIRGNIFTRVCRNLWPKLPGWIKKRWSQPVDAAKVHKIAVSAYGAAGDTQFRIRLLKSHPDPDVRASAAIALDMYEDFHNEQVSMALADALLRDKEPQARAAIVHNGFAAHGDLLTTPVFIHCLSDTDPDVRTNAAFLLFRGHFDYTTQTISNFYRADPVKKKAVIEQLSCALKNDAPIVHDAAARWLWIIDGQRIAYRLKEWD